MAYVIHNEVHNKCPAQKLTWHKGEPVVAEFAVFFSAVLQPLNQTANHKLKKMITKLCYYVIISTHTQWVIVQNGHLITTVQSDHGALIFRQSLCAKPA